MFTRPLSPNNKREKRMLEKQEAMLREGLDPKSVSKIKKAGREMSYIEGWLVFENANRIFGFDNWTYSIASMDVTRLDDGSSEVYTIIEVRIQFPDGEVKRQDVGWGSATKKMGLELALKESVTDGCKRAFRGFGHQFGNSLYDKANAIHDGGADSRATFNDTESDEVVASMTDAYDKASSMEDWTKVTNKFRGDAVRLDAGSKKRMNEYAMKRRDEIRTAKVAEATKAAVTKQKEKKKNKITFKEVQV